MSGDQIPSQLTFTGYAPTIVIYGPEQASGDTVSTVQTPEARSVARISSAGTFSIEIKGPSGLGTPGEHRVAKAIRVRLQREGVTVSVRSGADADGVDRWIDTALGSFELQVTSVPRDSTLWHQGRRGSGATTVPTQGAADWIEDSILHKVTSTTTDDRGRMILALDAIHAGPLAEDAVIECYVEKYGSPTARFDFASVMLVGPTVDQCVRLGAGVL